MNDIKFVAKGDRGEKPDLYRSGFFIMA